MVLIITCLLFYCLVQAFMIVYSNSLQTLFYYHFLKVFLANKTFSIIILS